MPNPGIEWLNENELRAYPLTADSTRYLIKGSTSYDLYKLVLDALLVYPDNPDNAVIEIYKIKTTATDLIIYLSGKEFTVPNYLTATYPYYVRDTNYSLLVIGNYASSLPANNIFIVTGTVFEPSVVYDIPETLGVNQISLNGSPLTGDVLLQEGYQVSLIPKANNTIGIEVGRSEGDVLPCGDVKGLTSDCNSVVSSVNGMSPTKTGNPIKFIGKNHIVVLDDPDHNRIYLGFDFKLADVPAQHLTRPT